MSHMDCYNCQAVTLAEIFFERRNTTELHVTAKCTVCGWKGRVDG